METLEAAMLSPPTTRPAVGYLSDQGRVHQLALSLFSWRRFATGDVFVVDFGLTDASRRWLSQACGVRFLAPLAPPLPLDRFGQDIRRINAYREKARIGAHDTWADLGDRPV